MPQLEATTELKYVSPDLLDFDPENPRFAGLLDHKTQPAIQKELFGEPYYASALVDSLLENGFIDYEPLVVKINGSRYSVIEGNRRLAAIQEIRNNPTKYAGRKSDLDRIPVLVFPTNPDQQQQSEMRAYLGVRHLLGFREWPPISKATFLEKESQSHGGLERVLKETQMSKQQARRFLVPLRLLKKAKVKLPKGEDFWVLGEALQRSGIKSYIQLDVDSDTLAINGYDKKCLDHLMEYLYGPPKKDGDRDAGKRLVDDTRGLTRLGKVLASKKATAALRAGQTLDEAEIYVDTREESINRLFKTTKGLALLLKKLGDKDPGQDIKDLIKSFKQFEAAVKIFTQKMK